MFAPEGRIRIDRHKLAAKAKELDATIKRLTAMRDGLRHAVNCKAPSHMECPKFRRILRVAAARPIEVPVTPKLGRRVRKRDAAIPRRRGTTSTGATRTPGTLVALSG